VTDEVATELRKVASVLALALTKDMSRGDQVAFMNRAGFSNREISALTGSSESSIRGFISVQRKRASAED
jgi:hypothetical protein